MTGFPKKVRDLVMLRAGGFCEICGWHQPTQIHHRRARGMGSTKRPETNSASNALAVCLDCHAMAESKRQLSLTNGWLVRQNHTPAETPVLRYSGWVLLDDLGYTTPAVI